MSFPWQREDWQRLQTLRAHWPHALLLHGQPGIGKVEFARELAQGLLCEQPLDDGRPCGTCVACHWFRQRNHPDFRVVCPESLAGDAAPPVSDSDASDSKDAKDAKEGDDSGKKSKTLSKEIKIEQVRALLDFVGVGAHRGGMRVVLLYPAEALNLAAANALLKTLEEPPAGVAFLLVSANVERLLPTIVSRCRQAPMATPDLTSASAWLAAQGVDDPASLLAEAGGAPLAALALANDDNAALKRFTLEQLAAGGGCDAFACGEALHKTPVPVVLGWLQRWLYDLLATQTAAQPRYFPRHRRALDRLAGQIDPLKVAGQLKNVTRQRATEQHPLNARLVFEACFVAYRDLFA
jgi:DNA polymerase-3 subunit delta'